jgi:hypothetical protein
MTQRPAVLAMSLGLLLVTYVPAQATLETEAISACATKISLTRCGESHFVAFFHEDTLLRVMEYRGPTFFTLGGTTTADRLNGLDWKGEVWVKGGAFRSIRAGERWGQWFDLTSEGADQLCDKVWKRGGVWSAQGSRFENRGTSYRKLTCEELVKGEARVSPCANDRRKTVSTIEELGRAMGAWVTDNAEAEFAPAPKTVHIAQYSPVTPAQLEALLVPSYIAHIETTDAWNRHLEFYMTVKPVPDGSASGSARLVRTAALVRSMGMDGAFDSQTYEKGAIPMDACDGDIVWADGDLVRWPE